MKSYRKGKRYRFKNGNLIAPNTYFVRAMKYWAKDSFEAHKLLKQTKREIKELKLIIKELQNED